MSELSCVFRQCPTCCSLSLVWFAVEKSTFVHNGNQNKDKLGRFESLPDHLLFCCYLKEDGLHAVSWCFSCNMQWCWCEGGLRVTTLTAGQQNESSEPGIRAVAPGEVTRNLEYKARRVMW